MTPLVRMIAAAPLVTTAGRPSHGLRPRRPLSGSNGTATTGRSLHASGADL